MKTCDEMVKSLFERREEYLAEQKIKRRNAVISTALYGCAFAVIAGVGVWISGKVSQKPITGDSSMPSTGSAADSSVTATELPIIWAATPGNYGDIIDDMDFETEWNGKIISGRLCGALDKGGEDCLYAVEARYFPVDEQFVYNGKTLAQYEAEYGEKWDKLEPKRVIKQLLESADYLKIDNGDKISKDIYDELVSDIGDFISESDIEEKISEYIVDGIFLKDKAVQDITKVEDEWQAAMQAKNQAEKACRAHFYKEVGKQLEAKGIRNEFIYEDSNPEDFLDTGFMSDYLLLFISKEDFANLALVNKSDWIFCHAYNDTEVPIVWEEEIEGEVVTDYYVEWNGKQIHNHLWDALEKNENNDNSLFAVSAYYGKIDEQFVYNGKTLAEYEAEVEAQNRRVNSLNILVKEGEYLINNKDKYPSYYEDTIAEIGEDLLSEYIVNGVFQNEKASQDFAKAEEDRRIALQAHDKARAAYRAYVYEKTAKQLEAQGIKCVYSSDPDYLLMFISRDDFAKLELDNMSEWIFSHASKDIYWEEYVQLGEYTASDLPIEEND